MQNKMGWDAYLRLDKQKQNLMQNKLGWEKVVDSCVDTCAAEISNFE